MAVKLVGRFSDIITYCFLYNVGHGYKIRYNFSVNDKILADVNIPLHS